MIGRTDDLLIVKGVKLYPAAISNLVQELVPLATGEFRIVLERPGRRGSSRRCASRSSAAPRSTRPAAPASRTQLARALHQRMTVRPEITVVPAGTLERTALQEQPHRAPLRLSPGAVTFRRGVRSEHDRIPEEPHGRP